MVDLMKLAAECLEIYLTRNMLVAQSLIFNIFQKEAYGKRKSKNRKSKIENRKSKIENRKSKNSLLIYI